MAISKFNYNSFNVTPVAGNALSFNSDADGFTTQGASSMVLIKTLTASSSATLSFVDGADSVVLDDTYPVYVFKFINIHPATNNTKLQFQSSINSGSSYGVTMTSTAFFATHSEDGGTSSLSYDANDDLAQSTSFMPLSFDGIGNANDDNLSGFLNLFSPSSTTFVKHFTGTTNATRINTGQSQNYSLESFAAGYFNTTSAVDAVQFKMASGNIDAGTIKLYGIKDS